LKRTGESAITWKYFHQMHEVFAEKKSVNPPEEFLGSTFKSETLTLKDSASTSQEETVDIQENILPKKKKDIKERENPISRRNVTTCRGKEITIVIIKERNLER